MAETNSNPYAAPQAAELRAFSPRRFVAIMIVWTFNFALVGFVAGIFLLNELVAVFVAIGLPQDVFIPSVLCGSTGLGAGIGWAIGRRKARRLRERWYALHAERQELAEQLASRAQQRETR